ncbi:hypothetical protein [Pseudorhodobacter wandonensis]|nr:hypothetical protein [Pseudorhodobacter wandonensis]
MKTIFVTVACALFALSGCTTSGHYPISGEECTSNDPVLKLDANDCLP